MSKNQRKLKRPNHGKRPASHQARRRAKRKRSKASILVQVVAVQVVAVSLVSR